MERLLLVHGCAVIVAAIAATTDFRTGKIPNWLTLPPLFLAPLLHGWFDGRGALIESIVGIVACGAIPFVMFKMPLRGKDGKKQKPMHGGDVKLFAALGAILTYRDGIPAEFFAFIFAALFSLGALAWKGKLFRTLGNSFFLGLNPVLPKKWRREINPELLSMVRLGPAILAGVVLQAILANPFFARFG